ncbi:Hypothetical predicted protein [Pelobates cultripes]|uniref:Uncharacterized protein n=1 Tax=Pelobates cultripes TaxID=61616 RepID=A0AAD1SHV7_PELCU|nr:Hypothetical predicted protein [Pelobates cultripes]
MYGKWLMIAHTVPVTGHSMPVGPGMDWYRSCALVLARPLSLDCCPSGTANYNFRHALRQHSCNPKRCQPAAGLQLPTGFAHSALGDVSSTLLVYVSCHGGKGGKLYL